MMAILWLSDEHCHCLAADGTETSSPMVETKRPMDHLDLGLNLNLSLAPYTVISMFEPESTTQLRSITLTDLEYYRPRLEKYVKSLQLSKPEVALRFSGRLLRSPGGLPELARSEAWWDRSVLLSWHYLVEREDCPARDRQLFIDFMDSLAKLADTYPRSNDAATGLVMFTHEGYWTNLKLGKSNLDCWFANSIRIKLTELQNRSLKGGQSQSR